METSSSFSTDVEGNGRRKKQKDITCHVQTQQVPILWLRKFFHPSSRVTKRRFFGFFGTRFYVFATGRASDFEDYIEVESYGIASSVSCACLSFLPLFPLRPTFLHGLHRKPLRRLRLPHRKKTPPLGGVPRLEGGARALHFFVFDGIDELSDASHTAGAFTSTTCARSYVMRAHAGTFEFVMTTTTNSNDVRDYLRKK